MPTLSPNESCGRLYFALPRLLRGVAGGSTARAELNRWEGHVPGWLIFLISYVFFARFVAGGRALWLQIVAGVLLAFAVAIFWLMVLHVNSVIVKAARALRLPATIANTRAQSVLIGALTSAFAVGLLRDGLIGRCLAALWLVAVACNLLAAAVLPFFNATSSRR